MVREDLLKILFTKTISVIRLDYKPSGLIKKWLTQIQSRLWNEFLFDIN